MCCFMSLSHSQKSVSMQRRDKENSSIQKKILQKSVKLVFISVGFKIILKNELDAELLKSAQVFVAHRTLASLSKEVRK